eukprot:10997155-Prorocentrum_lima.AAC.1
MSPQQVEHYQVAGTTMQVVILKGEHIHHLPSHRPWSIMNVDGSGDINPGSQRRCSSLNWSTTRP